MAIIRRNDPFRDLLALQDHLFRTFDSAYRGSGREDEQSMVATWSPLVDILEDGAGITLKAELPEVDVKDVDIQVEGNTLTLKGERKLENEEKRDGYHRVERTDGAFSRAFSSTAFEAVASPWSSLRQVRVPILTLAFTSAPSPMISWSVEMISPENLPSIRTVPSKISLPSNWLRLPSSALSSGVREAGVGRGATFEGTRAVV